jgi:hypothetical protein
LFTTVRRDSVQFGGNAVDRCLVEHSEVSGPPKGLYPTGTNHVGDAMGVDAKLLGDLADSQ